MNNETRILIVDDDESTSRTLSLVFGRKGYETEVAGTGREAIEKVQERFFNLALLDIKLPDMEGVELIAPLRGLHPDMVVIMITAYASVETAVRALDEGASAYITKPLNMDEVLAVVREALEKQRLIEDKRQAEEALRLSHHFLEIANRHTEMLPLLEEFVVEVKTFTGCAAVGIRLLDEEGNIPYQAYEGFSRRFYESESPLSIKSDQCMCINVIKRTTDRKLSYYTEGGSYYIGGTTRFLATVSEEEKEPTRNVCNQFGYESVALVPIRAGDRILGLIHVADPQENMVPLEMVEVLEAAAMELGTAIQRVRAEEALRESEERYRTLFENAPVGLGVADAEGNLLAFNGAMLKPGGYTREDIARMGNVAHLYCDPDERARTFAIAQKQGFLYEHEVQFQRRDGTWYDASLSMTPITIEGQHCWQAVVEDITERKQRERELEAIATIAIALRTATTRAEMLPVILDQVLTLLQGGGAALGMHDPISGEIVFELGDGAWTNWTGVRLPPGKGINGHVIATGQPYLNNDVRSDPRLARPDLIGELRAAVCVPLIAQEQTVGTLWVGRKTDITEAEVRLLTAIADMAANAIHRATLHEQTQRRLQQVQALRTIDMAITSNLDVRVSLNVILDQVTAQLGVDATDVLLLDPHTQTLEYAAGRGFRSRALQHTSLRLGVGYAGQAALERRSVNIPNIAEAEDGLRRSPLLPSEEFIAYYAAPLIAKGHVKGVLEIFHRAPLAPDQDWLDFLQTLATQAAIAIDNAELFDNLQRSNVELTLAYDTTLEGWSRALEMRDYETEGHTQRVTEMTLRLARTMNVPDAELVHVRRGALLHDIGKIAISDTVLLKPGPLTDEEWEIMRQHPIHAYELLSPIRYLRPSLDIPYYHHEKWDGTGYPRGLKGEQIPLAARIFAVVDVWDALRSDRPYRAAWPEERALEHIREQAGKHFDPQVVEMFLKLEMEKVS